MPIAVYRNDRNINIYTLSEIIRNELRHADTFVYILSTFDTFIPFQCFAFQLVFTHHSIFMRQKKGDVKSGVQNVCSTQFRFWAGTRILLPLLKIEITHYTFFNKQSNGSNQICVVPISLTNHIPYYMTI